MTPKLNYGGKTADGILVCSTCGLKMRGDESDNLAILRDETGQLGNDDDDGRSNTTAFPSNTNSLTAIGASSSALNASSPDFDNNGNNNNSMSSTCNNAANVISNSTSNNQLLATAKSKNVIVPRQHSIFMTISGEGAMMLFRPPLYSLPSEPSPRYPLTPAITSTTDWAFIWTALHPSYRLRNPLHVFDSRKDGMSMTAITRAIIVAAGIDGGKETAASRAILNIHQTRRGASDFKGMNHRGHLAYDDDIPSILMVKTAGGARFGFFFPFRFRNGVNFSRHPLEHAFAFRLGSHPRVYPFVKGANSTNFILSVQSDHLCVGADEPAFWMDGSMHWAVAGASKSFAGLDHSLTTLDPKMSLTDRLLQWQKVLKNAKDAETQAKIVKTDKAVQARASHCPTVGANTSLGVIAADGEPFAPSSESVQETPTLKVEVEHFRDYASSPSRCGLVEEKDPDLAAQDVALEALIKAQDEEDALGVLGAFEAEESEEETDSNEDENSNNPNSSVPSTPRNKSSVSAQTTPNSDCLQQQCGDNGSSIRLPIQSKVNTSNLFSSPNRSVHSEDSNNLTANKENESVLLFYRSKEKFFNGARECFSAVSTSKPLIPAAAYQAAELPLPAGLFPPTPAPSQSNSAANSESANLLAKYSKAAKSSAKKKQTEESERFVLRQMQAELTLRLNNSFRSGDISGSQSFTGDFDADGGISRMNSSLSSAVIPEFRQTKATWRFDSSFANGTESTANSTDNQNETNGRKNEEKGDGRDFKILSLELFLLDDLVVGGR
eukprot:GDKJ01047893.1.p1 GENE.GDKJ01047893.1~~GDKJ01047893.1.p1  ORF type:complete len:780 (+),score=209.33 GDKJ01047893.1:635-2974(+)